MFCFWRNPVSIHRHGLSRGAGCLLLLVAVAMPAAAQDPPAGAGDQPPLVEQIRSAAADFEPIDAERLQAAAQKFARQLRDLERYLGPDTANGERWKTYLGWDGIEPLLVEPAAPEDAAGVTFDFAEVARLYRDVRRRLNGGEAGLELPPFRRAMAALQEFYNVVLAAQLEENRAAYQQQLDALAEAVEKFEATPTARAERELGTQLGVITALGYSPDVVQAVRQRYHQPNTYVEVSTSFLNRAAAEPINERDRVRDCILGTNIRGHSHTCGVVSVRPIPATDRAILEFVSRGRSTSQTVGTNDPAIIRSSGVTNFVATKRVEFTDPSFRVLPARADADVRTRIQSVDTSRRGPFSGIIRRVASNQAQQSKPQAEAIAARHAEQRIRREFNDDLLEQVQDLRRQYRDDFRVPMHRYGEFPKFLQFSSSNHAVDVKMMQVNYEQLAASTPPPPPPLPPGHDLVARLHQTALSNYLAMFLSGATVSETAPDIDPEIDAKVPEWIDDLLDEINDDDEFGPSNPEPVEATGGVEGPQLTDAGQPPEDKPFEPWSIRFRSVRPVSVLFAEGQVTLVVHAAEFKYGDRSFRNWDLVARYHVQPQDGGLLLTRDSDIEMFPATVDFEAGQRVPNRLLPERSNLNKAINNLDEQGDGIPEEMQTDPLEFTDDLSDVGTMWLRHAVSDGGWLTLGWDL